MRKNFISAFPCFVKDKTVVFPYWNLIRNKISVSALAKLTKVLLNRNKNNHKTKVENHCTKITVIFAFSRYFVNTRYFCPYLVFSFKNFQLLTLKTDVLRLKWTF